MSETTHINELPPTCMMAEAFDLARGGRVYYVTGGGLPPNYRFRSFKTRDEAKADALAAIENWSTNPLQNATAQSAETQANSSD